MIRLGKLEKALLVLSTLIILTSVGAITLGYEHVLQWFDLEEQYSHNKLAEVREVQDTARRKEYLTPEFRLIKDRQAVFSNDSIMTGHESGLTLNFLDGSKVELGPDTMVEVKARGDAAEPEKFHFDIRVEKGKVQGTSPKQTVIVQQVATQEVEVLKPELTPSPAPVVAVSETPVTVAVAQPTQAPELSQSVAVVPAVVVAPQVTPIPAVKHESMELAIDLSYLKPKVVPVAQATAIPKAVEKQREVISASRSSDSSLVAGPQIVSVLDPVLRFPVTNGKINYAPEVETLFTWSSLDGVGSYLFEVAETDEFVNPVYQGNTRTNFIKYALPSRGIYYWRVTDLKSEQTSKVAKIIVR